MRRLPLSLKLGIAGSSLLTVVALLGPLFYKSNAAQFHLEREFCTPNWSFLMGCDGYGVDLLFLLLKGARLSLLLAVSVTTAHVIIGLLVGSLAAMGGTFWDKLVMRLLDIVFAFPGMLLAIALAALLRPGLLSLFFCLSCTGWASYARLTRAEILVIKEAEFIEAARALGQFPLRILIFHIWPNLMATLSVAITFGLANTILAEAGLSFLGLGLGSGAPSWGSLLYYGRDVILEAPHVSIFAGLSILLCVASFNLIGQGLRSYLNPQSN